MTLGDAYLKGEDMNKAERLQMVKAMEFIVRHCNDERCMNAWLMCGVADGDIEYGDLAVDNYDDLEYYLEDENFADLMGLFLKSMKFASATGGLYCGNIVSK